MKKLYIVIDNIRSAYNVGSIFRTADGVGNTTIYICGIAPTPEHIIVAKTSLGSTDSVEWKYFKTTKEAIEDLKKQNIPVFAVEITDTAKLYCDFKYPEICALVLGHETEGVSRHILKICDDAIYVPMNGKKESLNVATTAGIVMYEAMKDNFKS